MWNINIGQYQWSLCNTFIVENYLFTTLFSYPGCDSRRSTLLESRNQDSIRVQVPDNTPSLRYLISIYYTLSKACIDDNRGNQSSTLYTQFCLSSPTPLFLKNIELTLQVLPEPLSITSDECATSCSVTTMLL